MFGRPDEEGDEAVGEKKSVSKEYVRKPRAPKIKLHSDVATTKKLQKKINKLR